MSDLYCLTDEQMARLAPYFPKSHGKPRVDDKRVLSGSGCWPTAAMTLTGSEMRWSKRASNHALRAANPAPSHPTASQRLRRRLRNLTATGVFATGENAGEQSDALRHPLSTERELVLGASRLVLSVCSWRRPLDPPQAVHR